MSLTLSCAECGSTVVVEAGASRRPLTCPRCRAALVDEPLEVVEERLQEVADDEETGFRRGRPVSDKDDPLPPTPRKRIAPRPAPAPRDNVCLALVVVASTALGLLGLSSWLPFWSFQIIVVQAAPDGWPFGFGAGSTEHLSLADTWRGKLFILASFLSALAVAGAYLGHAEQDEETDWLNGLGAAVGVSWALVVLLWAGGYLLWWQWVRQPANGEAVPFAGGTLRYVQNPSLGCYAAVALASLGLLVSAAAAWRRGRLRFAFGGAALGLLVGGVLILADVRPWSNRVAWFVTPSEVEQFGKMFQNPWQPNQPPPNRP